MAYQAFADVASALAMQIHYNQGYISLLNESVAEFNSLLKLKVATGVGEKQTNFLSVGSYPHSNFQMVDPGATDGAFISGQSVNSTESYALMKEMNSVMKIQRNVWERAKIAKNKYLNPFEIEQRASQIVNANAIAIKFHGDGTGLLASLSSATATVAISGGYVTYPLNNVATKFTTSKANKGFVRWLKEGQKVGIYAPDGTARTVAGGSHSYFQVEEVTDTLSAPTVKLSSRTSAGVLNTSFSSITSLAADDCIYDIGQANYGAVSDLTGTIADFGNLVNMPGMISLSADDSRVVNGITHSGLSKGVRTNVAAALDFSQMAALLTKIEYRNSMENYDWKEIQCAGEVFDYLAEINEGQRFLLPFDDDRGVKSIGYWHRTKHLKLEISRYVPSYFMYFMPSMKSAPGAGNTSEFAPIQFRFSDWKPMKTPDGGMWRNDEDSGGVQVKSIRADMVSFGTFLTTRPSTIGVLEGFTI
jgi:hypothetical protein